MNPYFTSQEYTRRYERALNLMQARGMSALLVTSERNLYYLTGHQPFCTWHSTTRPTILVLPAEGEPALLVHEVWKGAAQRDGWLSDVHSYSGLGSAPLELIVSVLQQRRLSAGRIGAELGFEQRLGMSPADFHALQDALPHVEWLDAAALLWRLRLLKSPAEIACMRKACAATKEAFQRAYSQLAPGMTQEEVVCRLRAAISDAGAEVGFVSATFDAETHQALGCLPSSKLLQAGDVVFTDMGAVYHGYWSDFSRAASLGQPSERVLRLWEAIHRVTMRGVQAMRPGVPICDVVKACAGEAERQSITLNFAAGRIGHSIGLMLTEPPSLTLEERALLEPGMTLTLEPGIVSSEGVFVVEQNVAITEDGAELLSAGPWEIWVV